MKVKDLISEQQPVSRVGKINFRSLYTYTGSLSKYAHFGFFECTQIGSKNISKYVKDEETARNLLEKGLDCIVDAPILDRIPKPTMPPNGYFDRPVSIVEFDASTIAEKYYLHQNEGEVNVRIFSDDYEAYIFNAIKRVDHFLPRRLHSPKLQYELLEKLSRAGIETHIYNNFANFRTRSNAVSNDPAAIADRIRQAT
jgi:hypothetical protein